MRKLILTALLALASTVAFAQIPVTFQVDMGVQVFKGAFTPGVDLVVARGDFQEDAGDPGGNWQGDMFELTDVDGDTIYTGTFNLPTDSAGKMYNFKYVISPDGWEGGDDRTFTLTAPSVMIPVDYFNRDSSYATQVVNTIQFTADISGILNIGAGGAFDPNQDSLLVMGLNWDGLGILLSDESERKMVEDPFNPGTFQAELSVQGNLGDSTKWKFKAFPDDRFAGGGWESGSDRWHTYVEDSLTVLPTIVPRIQPLFPPLTSDVDITFTVDMTGAVNQYNGMTIPLNELEFVGMRGAADFLGSWTSGGCWCLTDTINGEFMKVLTDIGNNMWQITTTAPTGTNGGTYEYKFAAYYPGADTVNGGSSPLDNEGGFGENHIFLLQDGPDLQFDLQFGVFTTDVKLVDDLVPAQYQLEQNYPNPFNPSTVIKYNLPEAGLVTLKVYNALGQEVAELVNQEQIAGVYEATFDASRFSSGVYFYTITVDEFTQTKKMMLLK